MCLMLDKDPSLMKRKRHTPEQIIRKLRKGNALLAAGQTIGQVCQALEITESTFHRWRSQYSGMKVKVAKRMQELEKENKRLKRLLAELERDKLLLKAAWEGNVSQVPATRRSASQPGQGPRLPGSRPTGISPARRRQAVAHVQQRVNVSQRRACQVLGQSRSTQRYQAKEVSPEEMKLVSRIHELARQYPHAGYRTITAKLRQEGWTVSLKKIYRLWRREGLNVPRKTREKRRSASAD
ncbi:MAG: hypothetical protein KatS3mg111_2328 [Pirellulaceae bacterium]|nr:MAG: hypothetical protein KatS3mg111_2328 [Pirellulaceae bacterium]